MDAFTNFFTRSNENSDEDTNMLSIRNQKQHEIDVMRLAKEYRVFHQFQAKLTEAYEEILSQLHILAKKSTTSTKGRLHAFATWSEPHLELTSECTVQQRTFLGFCREWLNTLLTLRQSCYEEVESPLLHFFQNGIVDKMLSDAKQGLLTSQTPLTFADNCSREVKYTPFETDTSSSLASNDIVVTVKEWEASGKKESYIRSVLQLIPELSARILLRVVAEGDVTAQLSCDDNLSGTVRSLTLLLLTVLVRNLFVKRQASTSHELDQPELCKLSLNVIREMASSIEFSCSDFLMNLLDVSTEKSSSDAEIESLSSSACVSINNVDPCFAYRARFSSAAAIYASKTKQLKPLLSKLCEK